MFKISLPSSKRQNWPKKNKTKTAQALFSTARRYVYHIRPSPSADWLQNYLNTIEATNTFEDRQSKPDIHKNIFKLKSAEKLKYSASAEKNNILMKKSVKRT